MSNKNYIKGVRKERALVNKARKLGHIAFRSAGSHSPIDVIIIDRNFSQIKLIQCKPDNFSETKRLELLENYKDLNGCFDVSFEVL